MELREALGPLAATRRIEIIRMAGTETNLVARLRQQLSNHAADVAGTDNSDFHTDLDSFRPGGCRKRARSPTGRWEIQPNGRCSSTESAGIADH